VKCGNGTLYDIYTEIMLTVLIVYGIPNIMGFSEVVLLQCSVDWLSLY